MLNLDTDIISNLLDKARQFQVKEDVSFPETDDDMDALHVLAEDEDDATYQETVEFINDLREDQQATLVALMYVGRGDFIAGEWDEAYKTALEEMTDHTGEYLLSRPLVADYIEQGMDALGIGYKD
jgi:hypothetical protein